MSKQTRQGLEQVGKIISRKRRELGISRSELAKRAKVSSATITKLEDGRQPSLWKPTCRGLAKALGFSAKALWSVSLGVSPKAAIAAYPYHGPKTGLPERNPPDNDDIDSIGNIDSIEDRTMKTKVYLSKIQRTRLYHTLQELGDKMLGMTDKDLFKIVEEHEDIDFPVSMSHVTNVRKKLGYLKSQTSGLRSTPSQRSPSEESGTQTRLEREDPPKSAPKSNLPSPEDVKRLASKIGTIKRIRELEKEVSANIDKIAKLEALVKEICEALEI